MLGTPKNLRAKFRKRIVVSRQSINPCPGCGSPRAGHGDRCWCGHWEGWDDVPAAPVTVEYESEQSLAARAPGGGTII